MTDSVNHTDVNRAAFAAAATSAIGTAGSALAAITVGSTVATVAFGVFSVTGFAISIATISAWVRTDSGDVKAYKQKFKSDVKCTIAVTYAFVALALLAAQGDVQPLCGKASHFIGSIPTSPGLRVPEPVVGPDWFLK